MQYSRDHVADLFMDLLIQNASYSAFASTVEQVLEHPAKISDITRNPLAFSPNYPKDDDEDHRNLYRHIAPNQQGQHQTHLTAMLLDGKPVLWAYPYMRRNRYLCGALYYGKWMGHLTLPDVGRFDTLDLDLAAYCAKMLGIFLWIKGAPHEDDTNNGHFLLWALLNGLVKEEDLFARVIYPVFDGLSVFRLLWWEDGTRMEQLTTMMKKTRKPFWLIAYHDGCVMLTGENSEHQEKKDYESIISWTTENRIWGSISDPFSNVMQTSEQFQLIQRTLSYARMQHAEPGLYFYDDYKLAALMEDSRKHLDMRLYEHSLLSEMEYHDQLNHTEYTQTIQMYLLCHQDVTLTAAKMHIHKNTVLYRLNKIKELFDVDFSDILCLTNLYVSMLIQNRSVHPNL